MALQRNLKALGTFGYQTTARGNPVYLQYIPRTLNYVRENLRRYPRFEPPGDPALRTRQRTPLSGAKAGLRAILSDSMHVYIEDIAKHEGQSVTIKGWLANRRSSGKIHFLQVRDGSGFIQAVMSKAAVGDERVQGRRPPVAGIAPSSSTATSAPTRGRPAASRSTSPASRSSSAAHRLPHHAEGTRRRLPDGPPASLDPCAAPAGHPAGPARSDRRRARLLQQPRLHPGRHADLHAVRVRRHDHAVPRAVLRRRHGVPDAERPAVQRSQRDGARPRVLLRPDVPRGEVEDAPAPDRVLDGRAGDGLRRSRRRHPARRGTRGRGHRPRARAAQARTDRRSSATPRSSPRSRRPFAAHHVRRRGQAPEGEGPAVRVGRRLRQPG